MWKVENYTETGFDASEFRIAEVAHVGLPLSTRLSFHKSVKGSASQPADMTAA